MEPNISLAIQLFNNATALGSWRAPHQLMLVSAAAGAGARRSSRCRWGAFCPVVPPDGHSAAARCTTAPPTRPTTRPLLPGAGGRAARRAKGPRWRHRCLLELHGRHRQLEEERAGRGGARGRCAGLRLLCSVFGRHEAAVASCSCCFRGARPSCPTRLLPPLLPHSILPAAEGDYFGAAVRYALLAEQGSPTAVLNLAWRMHRGVAYRGADRHRLALGLWERGAARGQTEGMLMAAHVLMDGERYRLEGGERAAKKPGQGQGGLGSTLGVVSAGHPTGAAQHAHHLPSWLALTRCASLAPVLASVLPLCNPRNHPCRRCPTPPPSTPPSTPHQAPT